MTMKFDIEIRSIEDIRPYDNNPRINDDAVEAVAASLKVSQLKRCTTWGQPRGFSLPRSPSQKPMPN